MVEYQCNKCKKIFVKKYNYLKHIKRKTSCTILKKYFQTQQKFKCKYCGKLFNRKDNYNRHTKSCNKKNNTPKKIKQNIIKNRQIIKGDNNINNNNNIVIKQYNLFPFGKDGIDCLTTPEKVAIFSSDENPMEMIIVKVNLDPSKINHHNIGYTDEHRGYGIIFDGDSWLTERIDVIMEVLFESKEGDLLKIYDEIKEFLSDHDNNTIKDTLNDLNKKLNPRNKIDAVSKRNLVAHLKKHFYNNRDLIIEAKKHTNNNNKKPNHKNKLKNILKDGLTIEDIDRKLKLKKINDQRIRLKKEIAKDLLQNINEINDSDQKSIIKLIDQTTDINILQIIVRLLDGAYCFKNNINNNTIQIKIKKEDEKNKLLFG